MSYYLVFNHNVTDQALLEQHGQRTIPALMHYGAKVFVNAQAQNNMEENSGHSILVMEFESEEQAIQ